MNAVAGGECQSGGRLDGDGARGDVRVAERGSDSRRRGPKCEAVRGNAPAGDAERLSGPKVAAGGPDAVGNSSGESMHGPNF